MILSHNLGNNSHLCQTGPISARSIADYGYLVSGVYPHSPKLFGSVQVPSSRLGTIARDREVIRNDANCIVNGAEHQHSEHRYNNVGRALLIIPAYPHGGEETEKYDKDETSQISVIDYKWKVKCKADKRYGDQWPELIYS